MARGADRGNSGPAGKRKLPADRRALVGEITAGPADPPREGTHEVQSAITGAELMPDPAKVELRGRYFRRAHSLGMMPLISYAKIAKQGVDANSLDGMVAVYDLLYDCIYQGSGPDWQGCGNCDMCLGDPPQLARCPQYDPGDWDAFKDHATKLKIEGDELMGVVKSTIESLAHGRTGSPSESPSQPPPTSPNSKESSSATATATRRGGMPEPPGGFLDVATLSDR